MARSGRRTPTGAGAFVRVVTLTVALGCYLLAAARGAAAEPCECQEPAPCLSQGACHGRTGGVCSPGSQQCTPDPGSADDTTAPFWSAGYPAYGGASDQSISVNAELNEPATV